LSERLHKVIAEAGVCSRRAAERLVASGRVRVNGRVVSGAGSRVDPERDSIEVEGRALPRSAPVRVYLALNKPRGYVTTLSDPEGRRTVADLLGGVRERVFPVGRLDYASEGLLLVTNDGPWARRLMAPSSEVPKVYLVKVRGRPAASALARLRRGVMLDGRPARARAVRQVRSSTAHAWIELTVTEGRRHVVRRMLRAVGHPVLRLRRIGYGTIKLGGLAVGSCRALTRAELERLARSGQPTAERSPT